MVIDTQFQLGTNTLCIYDQHLIRMGRAVDRMPATGQKTWLQSIQIARVVNESQQESETAQMSKFMHSWLSRGQDEA